MAVLDCTDSLRGQQNYSSTYLPRVHSPRFAYWFVYITARP